MKLNIYLERNSIVIAEFAKKCDLSRYTIYNILKGKHVLLEVAYRIVKQTEGVVSYEDMLYQAPLRKTIPKKLDHKQEKI